VSVVSAGFLIMVFSFRAEKEKLYWSVLIQLGLLNIYVGFKLLKTMNSWSVVQLLNFA
jgi:hypothetical protein